MYLNSVSNLTPEVSVKNIIISLIDRLSAYALRNEDGKNVLHEVKLFEIFWTHIMSMTQERSDIPVVDLMSLSVALLNLVISCYPDEEVYIDKVLKFTYSVLEKQGSTKYK